MTCKLKLGNCVEVLKGAPDECIDLTITSPPYDDLRTYKGDWQFDFDGIARELYRVTKQGGVVVWVVNDATHKGSETGTSFRQALAFKALGFNLHDTMIWHKGTCAFPETNRYYPVFEYMFVLSKGKPSCANLIADRRNKWGGTKAHGTVRQQDGSVEALNAVKRDLGRSVKEFGARFNVWDISNPGRAGNPHPATFPLALATDHVLSWSNPGDTVLDPFMGSGTTGVAAIANGRRFVGIEISDEYLELARGRIDSAGGV